MKKVSLLLLLLIAETSSQTIFTRDHKIFIGCRPSLGECFNSCPDHRATAEVNPDRCDEDSIWSRYACYCLFQGET